jgi:hypothetical protein
MPKHQKRIAREHHQGATESNKSTAPHKGAERTSLRSQMSASKKAASGTSATSARNKLTSHNTGGERTTLSTSMPTSKKRGGATRSITASTSSNLQLVSREKHSKPNANNKRLSLNPQPKDLVDPLRFNQPVKSIKVERIFGGYFVIVDYDSGAFEEPPKWSQLRGLFDGLLRTLNRHHRVREKSQKAVSSVSIIAHPEKNANNIRGKQVTNE